MLPDPGGYDEQDAAKLDDFAILSAWFNYHTYQLTKPKGKRGGREERTLQFNELFGRQDSA